MEQVLLQIACQQIDKNITILANRTVPISLLARVLRGCLSSNSTSIPVYIDIAEMKNKETTMNKDTGALIYIVVVLLLYSCGIAGMIVKYSQKEKHEVEEEKILEDFYRGIPANDKKAVQRAAIQAFHKLTSFELRLPTNTDDDLDDKNHALYSPVDTILEDEDEEEVSDGDDDDDNAEEDDDDDDESLHFDLSVPLFDDYDNDQSCVSDEELAWESNM